MTRPYRPPDDTERRARRLYLDRLKDRKRSHEKEKSEWSARVDRRLLDRARRTHKKLPSLKPPRYREVPPNGYFLIVDRDGATCAVACTRDGKPTGKPVHTSHVELLVACRLLGITLVPVHGAIPAGTVYHVPAPHWRSLREALKRGTVVTARDDAAIIRSRRERATAVAPPAPSVVGGSITNRLSQLHGQRFASLDAFRRALTAR